MKRTYYICTHSKQDNIFKKNTPYFIVTKDGKECIVDEQENIRLSPAEYNYVKHKFVRMEGFLINVNKSNQKF